MASTMPVLVFVRDLMFSSRIMSAARASGITLTMIRDAAQLENAAGNQLIIDLNHPGAIEAASAWKSRQGGRVTGFVSHTDTQTIQRAKDAGIDQILARGQFVQILPEVLASREGEAPAEPGIVQD